MDDDLIINPDQFKVCMVKKSKHYYKTVGIWSAFLLSAFLISWGIVYGIDYISKILKMDYLFIAIVAALYIAFVMGLAYAVTNKESVHYVITFIRNIIAFHGVGIVFFGSLALDMICLSAIPVELAIILGQVIFNITGGNFGVAFIGAVIIFIATMPVNISAFQCFKIEAYLDGCMHKSLLWIKLKDVTFGDTNGEV